MSRYLELEKEDIIKQLFAAMQKDVIEAVPKMPAEWYGIEIREFIAHMAKAYRRKMTIAQRKAYKNAMKRIFPIS